MNFVDNAIKERIDTLTNRRKIAEEDLAIARRVANERQQTLDDIDEELTGLISYVNRTERRRTT